ncbi:ABC transporter ATP-binding protein [Microbacterium sp. NC79]|uniref:ABC transporter ATP-binding protein n=1 Tax=Microbacterium sp. NC79 TaxID=2851009 RepID=UPI0020B6AF08|nr:ABC transporter ATP-binding protein [Microbacterium sp. NC79]
MTSLLFDASRVSMQYPGSSKPAVNGVSLTVEPGRHLGIIGESGSGKTTLARMLLGLNRPTTGTINYRGQEVPVGRHKASRDFRRRVQVVLQDPFASLNPRMPVGRIIAEPVRALRPTWDARSRTLELLAAVGLGEEFAQRLPRELSGGQRQRVAIARALAPRPETVIADEPVSALDVSVRAHVLQLLRRLAAHEELTLIVISHDLGIVDGLCKDALVMRSGRIVEHGPVGDVLENPQADYTRELLASVPLLPRREDRTHDSH